METPYKVCFFAGFSSSHLIGGYTIDMSKSNQTVYGFLIFKVIYILVFSSVLRFYRRFHTITSKMLDTESIKLPCGYEEEFTIPVDDDLQCLICQLPLREPVLTRCGHRFCRQCLEKHMARLVLVLFVCVHLT